MSTVTQEPQVAQSPGTEQRWVALVIGLAALILGLLPLFLNALRAA